MTGLSIVTVYLLVIGILLEADGVLGHRRPLGLGGRNRHRWGLRAHRVHTDEEEASHPIPFTVFRRLARRFNLQPGCFSADAWNDTIDEIASNHNNLTENNHDSRDSEGVSNNHGNAPLVHLHDDENDLEFNGGEFMPGMIHKRSIRDHRMRRPHRRWQRRGRPGMREESSRREWRRRQQRPHVMESHTDHVSDDADEYTPTDRMRMRGERRQMRRMRRRYIRTHGFRLFCAAMDNYECDDVPDSLVTECERLSSEPEVEPSSDIVV